jgi:hypothetical protein
MVLSQLLALSPKDAMDWLQANSSDFELVPISPSEEMCEAFNNAQEMFEDGKGESPDIHWGSMISAHRSESNQ